MQKTNANNFKLSVLALACLSVMSSFSLADTITVNNAHELGTNNELKDQNQIIKIGGSGIVGSTHEVIQIAINSTDNTITSDAISPAYLKNIRFNNSNNLKQISNINFINAKNGGFLIVDSDLNKGIELAKNNVFYGGKAKFVTMFNHAKLEDNYFVNNKGDDGYVVDYVINGVQTFSNNYLLFNNTNNKKGVFGIDARDAADNEIHTIHLKDSVFYGNKDGGNNYGLYFTGGVIHKNITHNLELSSTNYMFNGIGMDDDQNIKLNISQQDANAIWYLGGTTNIANGSIDIKGGELVLVKNGTTDSAINLTNGSNFALNGGKISGIGSIKANEINLNSGTIEVINTNLNEELKETDFTNRDENSLTFRDENIKGKLKPITNNDLLANGINLEGNIIFGGDLTYNVNVKDDFSQASSINAKAATFKKGFTLNIQNINFKPAYDANNQASANANAANAYVSIINSDGVDFKDENTFECGDYENCMYLNVKHDGKDFSTDDIYSITNRITFAELPNELRIAKVLAWQNTAQNSEQKYLAHGTFNIDEGKTFTLSGVLKNHSNLDSSKNVFGWDGKSLTKKGKGTLVLAGKNEYSGDTTVADGTLDLGSSTNKDAVIAGAVSLNKETLFNNYGSIAGKVETSGRLFENYGTIGGAVNINNGTFNNRQTGEIKGDVNIAAGSWFNNAGSVNGKVEVNGILSAFNGSKFNNTVNINSGGIFRLGGDEVQELKFTKDINFAKDSTLEIRIKDKDNYDKLSSTDGIVNIAAGAKLWLKSYGNGASGITKDWDLDQGQPFTIITAKEINGNFVRVEDSFNKDFLNVSENKGSEYQIIIKRIKKYDPNEDNDPGKSPSEIKESGNKDNNYVKYAESTNQEAVANVINGLDDNNDLKKIIDVQFGLNSPHDKSYIPNAYNALSGEIYAAIGSVIQTNHSQLREVLNTRFSTNLENAKPAANLMRHYNLTKGSDNALLWLAAFGGNNSFKQTSNLSKVSSNNNGLLFGLDRVINPNNNLFGGFVFGQESATIKMSNARNSESTVNAAHIGVYLGSQIDAIKLRGGFTFSDMSIKTKRSVDFINEQLKGRQDAKQTGLFVEGATDLNFAFTKATFTPYANLAAVKLSIDDADEEGGKSALKIASSSSTVTSFTLGSRASYELSKADIFADAAYRYTNASSKDGAHYILSDAGKQQFKVQGSNLAENSFVLGGGVNFALSKTNQIGFDAKASLGSKQKDYAANLNFAASF